MLSICSSAISCPSTYPQKTLSNGLFLSKAAGFINHMTTNFKKKYVLKKNIHRYMYINTINIKLLHKPPINAKKDTSCLDQPTKNSRYWFITRRIQGYLGHLLLPPSSPPLMAAVVCVHGSVLVPRCRCP